MNKYYDFKNASELLLQYFNDNFTSRYDMLTNSEIKLNKKILRSFHPYFNILDYSSERGTITLYISNDISLQDKDGTQINHYYDKINMYIIINRNKDFIKLIYNYKHNEYIFLKMFNMMNDYYKLKVKSKLITYISNKYFNIITSICRDMIKDSSFINRVKRVYDAIK